MPLLVRKCHSEDAVPNYPGRGNLGHFCLEFKIDIYNSLTLRKTMTYVFESISLILFNIYLLMY